MNWIKTPNASIDPLEIESVIIKRARREGYLDENNIYHRKEFTVYRVGVVTKSGTSYLVAEYTDEVKARELKEELEKQISKEKVDYFNDTWERLVAVLGKIREELEWINKNMPAEV
jgi:hypothetical protein